MTNFINKFYKTIFKSKSQNDYGVKRKNVKTIKDLVLEAAKLYKTKPFINYQDDNEMKKISFKEVSSNCESYSVWINDIKESLLKPIHVGLLGVGNVNYFMIYLATMFSGNLTVPIDPSLEINTLIYCIDFSDIDILFYESKYRSKISILKEKCPKVKYFIPIEKDIRRKDILEDGSEEENNKEKDFIDIMNQYEKKGTICHVKKNQNALIIFTSGTTTGKKKAVVLTHENLIDRVFSSIVNKNEVYLQILPYYHIFSTCDFFGGLRYGHRICLNLKMENLIHNLQLYQPTRMNVVPLIAKNLLNRVKFIREENPNISKEEARNRIFGKNLKKIVCGGGFLSPELAKAYEELDIRIGQGYGMTETSSKGTLPDFNPKYCSSVGMIAPSCKIRIVDDEIQIKSKSCMKGYYKNPKETQKIYTKDGWIRTGDLGYFKENHLYLIGRKKNLIILSNGENVSPEVLEGLYDKEMLFKEIIIYGDGDVLGMEVYPNMEYAKLVLDESKENSLKRELWNVIEQKNKALPSYERIVKLSVRDTPFIKTSSNKIIRSAFMKELKKRKESSSKTDNTVDVGKEKKYETQPKKMIMPTTDIQKKIYSMVRSTLGSRSFDITSDLYDYGLDSFCSMSLVTEIGKEYNIKMELSDIVHHSSIVQLEEVVKSKLDRQNQEDDTEKIDLSPREAYRFISSQTVSGLFLKGTKSSNINGLFRLHPKVDLLRLKKAIEKLIDIHVELKMTLNVDEDGQYYHYRHDDRKADIKIIELTDEEWNEKKKNILVPYYSTPDELMYQITIYKTEVYNYLYFSINHIISDGQSYKVLMNDLEDIYAGREVLPKDYTFFEYTLEYNANEAKALEREKNYYKNLLDGITVHNSPFAHRKADVHGLPKPNTRKGEFSKINHKDFMEFCEKEAVTPNTLFLTAAGLTVCLMEGCENFLIASAHNGRINQRWDRVIGFMTKTYAFRYDFNPNETIMDALHRSSKQILTTMSLTHVAYDLMNSFIIQYQGNLRQFDTIGGHPTQMEPVPFEFCSHHICIFDTGKKFTYARCCWENIFDLERFEMFIEIVEEVIVAVIQGARKIDEILDGISHSYITERHTISVEALNDAIGEKFISSEEESKEVLHAYILDKNLKKHLLNGWGDLYLEENDKLIPDEDDDDDHTTKYIKNPFGEGRLYKTGYTGYFSSKGELTILENDSRYCILPDRTFPFIYENINGIEKAIKEYEGVEKVTIDLKYISNVYKIIAHVYGIDESNKAALTEFLKFKLESQLIPENIVFHN